MTRFVISLDQGVNFIKKFRDDEKMENLILVLQLG